MEDSKFTYRKVNICLPMILAILGIDINTKLQMFLSLTLGAVLVPEPFFYQDDHFIIIGRDVSESSRCSDGLHWELLRGVTGCGSFDLIPFSYFLLELFQFNNWSRIVDFLTSFETPHS